MPSQLFESGAHRQIGMATLKHLQAQEEFLSPSTRNSPRAVGDAVQEIIAQQFAALLGPWHATYSVDFARRAMADLAFEDADGNYYVVDVKTHRTDTKFNMPNLTSVDRLARFYEDDTNFFTLLMIKYHLAASDIIFTDALFVPIEHLSWTCLTVGALGWGQIQIANANTIVVDPMQTRRQWMLELCEVMMEFYPREIAKISERIRRFEQLRAVWLNRMV